MKLFTINLLGMVSIFAAELMPGKSFLPVPVRALLFGINAISCLSEAYDFHRKAKAHDAALMAQAQMQKDYMARTQQRPNVFIREL